MHWKWKSRAVGSLAVCAVAYLISRIVHKYSQSQLSANSEKQEPNAENQWLFIPPEVTLEQLSKPFRDSHYTDIQAAAATKHYIGKWIRYSGRVRNVEHSSIWFKEGEGDSFVLASAQFEEKWPEHLSILPREKRLTIEGRVDTIAARGVILGNCEILNES